MTPSQRTRLLIRVGRVVIHGAVAGLLVSCLTWWVSLLRWEPWGVLGSTGAMLLSIFVGYDAERTVRRLHLRLVDELVDELLAGGKS